MLSLMRILLLSLLALAGAVFVYLNPGPVTLSLHYREITLPLGVFSLLLLGAGLVSGAAIGGWRRVWLQRRLNRADALAARRTSSPEP